MREAVPAHLRPAQAWACTTIASSAAGLRSGLSRGLAAPEDRRPVIELLTVLRTSREASRPHRQRRTAPPGWLTIRSGSSLASGRGAPRGHGACCAMSDCACTIGTEAPLLSFFGELLAPWLLAF